MRQANGGVIKLFSPKPCSKRRVSGWERNGCARLLKRRASGMNSTTIPLRLLRPRLTPQHSGVLFIPLARRFSNLAQPFLSQPLTRLLLHGFGEKSLITPPFACRIQRNDKKVAIMQRLKHLCAIFAFQYYITKRSR